MTDSKTLHTDAEKDFVVKLGEIETMLQNAEGNLSPLVERIDTHLGKQDGLQFTNARQWIGKCMNTVAAAKQNLDSVTEILNTRKASLEIKEIALRSWPKKSYIERMTWIATALFPAGGVSFVFTGGLTSASLAAAIAIWLVGSLVLILSLLALKKDDDNKWKFFENEFGVQGNTMSALRTKFVLELQNAEEGAHMIERDASLRDR